VDEKRLALEKLKWDWSCDPCWDIEETEGFEEFRAELLKYRQDMELEWAAAHNKRMQDLAASLKCSVELARHIDRMERALTAQANAIDKLMGV
jgi:hypothetical protein